MAEKEDFGASHYHSCRKGYLFNSTIIFLEMVKATFENLFGQTFYGN